MLLVPNIQSPPGTKSIRANQTWPNELVGSPSAAIVALIVQRSTNAMCVLYQFMNKLIDRLIVR